MFLLLFTIKDYLLLKLYEADNAHCSHSVEASMCNTYHYADTLSRKKSELTDFYIENRGISC
jgi:hypothetical protein